MGIETAASFLHRVATGLSQPARYMGIETIFLRIEDNICCCGRNLLAIWVLKLLQIEDAPVYMCRRNLLAIWVSKHKKQYVTGHTVFSLQKIENDPYILQSTDDNIIEQSSSVRKYCKNAIKRK